MGIYEELEWRGLIKDVSDPSLREKLNNCISNGEDYSVIYKVSVELDELIAKYYDKNIFGIASK